MAYPYVPVTCLTGDIITASWGNTIQTQYASAKEYTDANFVPRDAASHAKITSGSVTDAEGDFRYDATNKGLAYHDGSSEKTLAGSYDLVSGSWSSVAFNASEVKTFEVTINKNRRLAEVTINVTNGGRTGLAMAVCGPNYDYTSRVIDKYQYDGMNHVNHTFLIGPGTGSAWVYYSGYGPSTGWSIKGIWIDQAAGKLKFQLENVSSGEGGGSTGATLGSLSVLGIAI